MHDKFNDWALKSSTCWELNLITKTETRGVTKIEFLLINYLILLNRIYDQWYMNTEYHLKLNFKSINHQSNWTKVLNKKC